MILLLPALLGLLLGECHGLRAGLLYQYKYTGTVSTWIPNAPTQFSGSALRANVELQLTRDRDILIKVDSVEVAQRNDNGTCDVQHFQEFSYGQLNEEDAAFLEQPFLVYVNASGVSYMKVRREPLWVTNIKRGIVNTLPLIPLTGKHPPLLSCRLTEETMIGRCNNWYSLLKLPRYQSELESKELEKSIEVDVQRESAGRITAPEGKGKKTGSKTPPKSKTASKTPSKTASKTSPSVAAPTITPALSILTRTLDDQECEENHFTIKINGNQESVERTQRSSQGTFLLRGDGAVLRLEKAEVDGDIVIYTGESDEEYIRITSKQALELRAVRQAREQEELAYELERRKLSFEIKSQRRYSLVEERLTDISPSEQQIQQILVQINEDLSQLANPQGDKEEEIFLEFFPRLVDCVALLTRTTIAELVTHIPDTPSHRYFLYHALLASGANEAQRYLLESMRDETFREANPLLVLQFFQATSITVRDPSLIPDLLDVVSSMGDREQVSRTASLLSIAQLARKLCLDQQTAETCESGCNTDFIVNTFLPTLSEGLTHADKWEKLVSLQAICALGTPYAFPILQPIIQGTNNDDIDLRINAMYCLTADLLPKTADGTVFDTLVPIMNNPTEFPEVRSIAFLVMTTWKPNLSWWEHVAISTWKESSTQMISFISSTLTTLSKGADFRSEFAKKVVHLAKHPANHELVTLAKSTYLYVDEVAKNCKAETSVKLAWLSSTASVFPRTIFLQLQYISVMGMTRREKVVFFTNELYNLFKENYPFRWKEHEDSASFKEVFEELKEELSLTTTSFTRKQPFSFLSYLEPLNLVIANEPQHGIFELAAYVLNNIYNNLPVHFRTVDSTLAFPSDIGLPVIIKNIVDEAASVGYQYETGTNSFSIRVPVHISDRHSLQVKTLVPWTSGQSPGAGLETCSYIYLPLNIKVDSTFGSTANIILGLPTRKVKLVSSSRIMYTSLTPLFPYTYSSLSPGVGDDNIGLKSVRSGDVHRSRTILLPKAWIHLESNWIGDFKKPEDVTTLLEKVDPTQLHYSNYDYTLVLDPQSSSTKNITFILSYVPRDEEHPSDPYTQEQGAAEYEAQFSQSASTDVDFEEITSAGSLHGQTQHSQTFLSHMDRMQAQIVARTDGKVHTVSFVIKPHNASRKYEVAITIAASKQRVGQKTPTKIHVTLQGSPVGAAVGDTNLMCLDFRTETPYLPPLLPKEVILEADLLSNFLVNIYYGRECRGSPAAKIEGFLDSTPAAMVYAEAKQERETCDGSFPRQIQPFYDHVHFDITWEQDYLNLVKAIQTEAVKGVTPFGIFKNKVPQPDNKITVDAVLNTQKDEWKTSVTGRHTTTEYIIEDSPTAIPSNIVQDYWFDNLNEDYDKVCRISENSVKTYDGLVRPFEPSSCWITAAINSVAEDASTATKQLQASVQIRFTDQWEVRLMWPTSALILEITRSDILVNEEPFSGYSDKFVLHRLQDSQLVEAGMILIWVGDRVEIRVSDVYYGEVGGLCGNYDNEPINDMIGPSGCLYSDPALHTTAWSTPGTGCSRFTLRNKKRELEVYRETCDKKVFHPTGISQHNVMENCTTWEYHERTSAAGLRCRTKVPIPVCQQGCQAGQTFTRNLKYDCWVPAPSGQKQQQQQQRPLKCSSTVLPVNVPSACFRQ